jgi:hypothetical protein
VSAEVIAALRRRASRIEAGITYEPPAVVFPDPAQPPATTPAGTLNMMRLFVAAEFRELADEAEGHESAPPVPFPGEEGTP